MTNQRGKPPYTVEELRKLLQGLPRVKLAYLPTPIEECPRLSAALGGPRIFAKRDDLTGPALGGNKIRKLEFWMADAQQKGADMVIAGSPAQTNHPRQTAEAASKLGVKAVLALWGQKGQEIQGNLLLDHLFGAEIQFVEEGDYAATVGEVLKEMAQAYRKKGHNPYVINLQAARDPLGAIGYLNCSLELWEQLEEMGLRPNYIITTCGSGGTHAGLALGAKLLEAPFKVFGINCKLTRAEMCSRIVKIANQAADLLGLGISLSEEEVLVDGGYVGEGYTIPSDQGNEAIKLVARMEGILLDPVYTGKSMSGLIDLSRKGRFGPDDTVLYIHTGGTPGLFAYHELLAVGAEKSIIIHEPN